MLKKFNHSLHCLVGNTHVISFVFVLGLNKQTELVKDNLFILSIYSYIVNVAWFNNSLNSLHLLTGIFLVFESLSLVTVTERYIDRITKIH